jgi:glycosyltransferase involved in cell wall biosynthesis
MDNIVDLPRRSLRRRKPDVVTLADRARDARQWGLAVQLYRKALDRNPRNPPIWVQYGHALKEWGVLREPDKLAKAETAYRRALALDPSVADTYLQLGHVLKLQDKTEEAKASYLRAFALDPSIPYPLQELGGFGWSEAHTAELNRLVASDTKSHSPITLLKETARREVQEFSSESENTASGGSLLLAPAATSGTSAPEDSEIEPLSTGTNVSASDQTEHEIRIIHESGLFDEAYYRANNRDLPKEADPVRHFVEWGAREARMPNHMFDPAFYLLENLDVLENGDNPLVHFIKRGACEGRRPHPYFDPAFYILKYPDVASSGENPLLHYLTYGEKEGRKRNPEEAKAGSAVAVTEVEFHCLKQPSFRDEVALFATHLPNGRLKPHVRHHLNSLKRQGIAVVLIAAVERPFTAANKDLMNDVDGIFVRHAIGYDFAAWAHVLLLHPELFAAKVLYLINDSVIGPTNDGAYAELLDRLRSSQADFIGLTENLDRNWHIQSYFLAFKPRALSSVALHKFVGDIAAYKDKEDVVNELELRFAPTLRSAGIECESLFSAARDFRDPTVYYWKQLLQSGFPFIKVKVIRDSFPGVDVSDWRDVLAGQDFDVSLAERTLAGEVALLGAKPPLKPMASQPLLAPGLYPVVPHECKVAYFGPWNYDNGLAVASRGYISALRYTGLPVNFHPIRRPFHIHQRVAPAVDMCDFSGPADVAIVHLNPDAWSPLLTDDQLAILERATARIGIWVWEMARIPRDWYPTFDNVDAIWAPSRYCADIYSSKSQVPVDVIPHVVTVDLSTSDSVRSTALRRELGLSAEDRIILYAFDGSSYLVRKNPFALIRSFARSRLAERGWRLVLKTKHLFDSPVQGRLLQQEVDSANGVVLVDRSADKETMRELMQASDIFASSHCSEGFGLTIAEAMAMGKIVVATDYGGSRDFLDAECGFPVRYRLHSPERDHGHYTREGGVWAQIDEAHLAEALIEASELVMAGDTRLGDAARTRINELCSPAAVGAKIRRSISQLLSTHKR